MRPTPLLLLAACTLSAVAAAAAARELAQTQTPPAVDSGGAVAAPPVPEAPESPYGSPAVTACVGLTNAAGSGCTVESDTSALAPGGQLWEVVAGSAD